MDRIGQDGTDGLSPTVNISKVGKTTTITITDKNGEHTATIKDGEDGSSTGDMLKSVYDTDNNGIVDNAEKVNNHTVECDVPSNAKFTDTVYDDTALSGRVTTVESGKVDKVNGKGLSAEDYTSVEKNKLSGIESGAQVNTITGVKGNSESTYRTGNVNITKEDIGLGISDLMNIFYPVGSYYETSDSTFNPNTAWGGTWVEDTEGQYLISRNNNLTVGNNVGSNSITLTTNNMPEHTHSFSGSHSHSHKPATNGYSFMGANGNISINGTLREWPSSGGSHHFVYTDTNNLNIVEDNNTNSATVTISGTTGKAGQATPTAIDNRPDSKVIVRWHRTA